MLCNSVLEQMTGLARTELIAKPFFGGIARAFDCDEIKAGFERALPPSSESTWLRWSLEVPNMTRRCYVVLDFRPRCFRDRHIVAIIVEDVDERTLLQLERERLPSALFHDLRSPLSSISSFTELFSIPDHGPVGKPGEDYLDASEALGAMHQIDTACRDMIELIDSTTRQLQGDNGESVLLDLALLTHSIALESLMVCSQARLNSRPVEVQSFAQDIEPVRVPASRAEASRTSRNLLANACKYASCRIELTISKDDASHPRFVIEDDGPDIPEGFEEKIFAGGMPVPGSSDSSPGGKTAASWVLALTSGEQDTESKHQHESKTAHGHLLVWVEISGDTRVFGAWPS